MKPTTSHKLFAILAVSGLTWTGSALQTQAQDGFGFVRPATAVKRPVVDVTPALPAQRISVPNPTDVDMAPPVVRQTSAQEAPPILGFQGPDAAAIRPLTAEDTQFEPLSPLPVAITPSTDSFIAAPPSMEMAPPAAAAPEVLPPTMLKPLEPMAEPVSDLPPQASLLAPLLDNAPAAPGESPQLPAGPEPSATEQATTEAEMAAADTPQVIHTVVASRTPLSFEIGSLPTADVPAAAQVTSMTQQPPAAPVVLGQMPPQVEVPPIINQPVRGPNQPPLVSGRAMNAGSTVTPNFFEPGDSTSPPQPIPLVNAPPTPKGLDPAYNPGDLPPAPAATAMPAPRRRTRLGQNLFNTQDPAPLEMSNDLAYEVEGYEFEGGTYDTEVVSRQFQSAGAVSWARRYAIFDALYYDRDDGQISNSNFGSLGNSDWEAGWRLTLGSRSDSVWGREISYIGTLPFEQTQTFTSATGAIQSRFIPADGLTPANTSGFFNATIQSQSKETLFHSVEINRVKWGWDVLKTYIGVRYILIDDSYTMYSQSIGGNQGFYQMDAINHLIGPQIGADLYYDVGYRFSFSLVSKLGVYGNANQIDTVMINDGTTYINQENNDGTVSGSYELGLNTHFQLSERARLRAGYNFLWLGDVATISDNFPQVLTPATGSDTDDEDDMFFHGVSFGFEVFR